MNLASSDRKRLLSLPFYLQKRNQNPQPKNGQPELELFKEIFGVDYYQEFGFLEEEEKITEFQYEKYIHPELLKDMDTQSEQFKRYIKKQNFKAKTFMEQHQENQKFFESILPLLQVLNKDEQRDLIHYLQN